MSFWNWLRSAREWCRQTVKLNAALRRRATEANRHERVLREQIAMLDNDCRATRRKRLDELRVQIDELPPGRRARVRTYALLWGVRPARIGVKMMSFLENPHHNKLVIILLHGFLVCAECSAERVVELRQDNSGPPYLECPLCLKTKIILQDLPLGARNENIRTVKRN